MNNFFRYSLTLCIMSIAILQFIQVVFRYLLNLPIILIDELVIYPTIWLYFLGCASAAREGTQISADIITTFMTNKKRIYAINTVADLVSGVLAAWLSYWAYDYFLYSLRVWKTSSYASIPFFYAEMALFVGFSLITIYTAINTVKSFRKTIATPA